MVLITACLTSELPPGTMKGLELLGRSILLANINGTIYAMDALCSHAMGSLVRGKLDGYTLECPRHQWKFDIRNGKLLSGPPEPIPTNKDLRAYPVHIRQNCVDIDLY
jgi:nitrite reductase/ring-hydroxylating ferredoxin subunit